MWGNMGLKMRMNTGMRMAPCNQYGKEMLRPEQHPQMRSGIARVPHILNMGPPMGNMGGG